MQKLKDIRYKKRLTQEKLAEISGVDQSTISSIENNPDKIPAWPTVAKLAKALDMKPEELFPVDSHAT
jgi:transcriptional regulator with XRE-family HTH domain